MTVLIRGMEMPSCCDDCWALDEYGDYPVCQITEEQRGYNFRTREKRMDKCPLVEVPTPHGRLIEARVLQHDMMGMVQSGLYGLEDMIDAVIEAPTVIEAEE